MAVSLDLRKAHRHHRHGDLLAVLTWVNDSRALVLFPWTRTDGIGWFIVDESASWKWNVQAADNAWRRDALDHADAQARIACQLWGWEPTIRNRARIINLVLDWIPELIAMPGEPDPTMSRQTYGDIVLTDRRDGKTIGGEEIRVPVNEGATYG